MHHMAQEQAPCIAGGAPAPSASHGALRRGGHSDWFFTSEATVAFIQVVAIDLVLAGDNAVVIGLAAAGLPPQQRMRAGNALLLQSDVLRAVAGKVATFAPETNESLREALFAASNGEAEIGSKGISLPLIGRTGERHAVHVLPLTSGARCKANTRAAAAAVFVRKSTLEYPSAPELIARAFGLTLAELRVLVAIVEIGGVPEVAEVLGIGATTVKTHLGRIYRKTGSTRQADLVKLVAGFSNPVG